MFTAEISNTSSQATEYHSEDSNQLSKIGKYLLGGIFYFTPIWTNSPDTNKQNRSKLEKKSCNTLFPYPLTLEETMWLAQLRQENNTHKEQDSSKPALRGTVHNGTESKRAFTHKKNTQCFQPHSFIGAASLDLQQRQHCLNTQLATPLLPCWGRSNFGMFYGSKPQKRFHVSLLWITSANFQAQGPSRKIWMSPRQKTHSLVTRDQISYVAPIYKCFAF